MGKRHALASFVTVHGVWKIVVGQQLTHYILCLDKIEILAQTSKLENHRTNGWFVMFRVLQNRIFRQPRERLPSFLIIIEHLGEQHNQECPQYKVSH